MTGWELSLVVGLLVAARLLLPLTIPRYALFGILACMILDSADQTVMEAFGIHFPRYQSYDKALDIYYLAIAYLATMRNWDNLAAFQIGRGLFYYRLVGVLAFELSEKRLLLAIFPNSFEPFFVYYEMVRRMGDPLRLSRNAMLAVVGVIWFVIKLPHEWWVHIAQMDTTDFIKTKILGAAPTTSFWKAIIEAPAVTGSLALVAAVFCLVAWRAVKARRRKRPPSARPVIGGSLPNETPERIGVATLREQTACHLRPWVLVEKILLVAIMSVVFQQILPGLEANGIRTGLFVAFSVVATDFLVRWGTRRYGVPVSTVAGLATIALLNFSVVLIFQYTLPFIWLGYDLGSALVFAALITLFVSLFDHYRPIHDVQRVRAEEDRSFEEGTPEPREVCV